MSYPIVPHPRIVTGSGTTTRVVYANVGRSAYARLASGTKTFITKTIPNFARRIWAGIYQVAKFVYTVMKKAANYVWTLAGRYSAQLVNKLKGIPAMADKAGAQISKATKGAAKVVGKAVGGSVRRVKDFNEGLAEGIAGKASDYVHPKFKKPDSVDKFGQRRVDKAFARGERRRGTVAGVTKRAVLGAEVAGALKLVSNTVSGIDILSANGLGVNLKKQSKGK